MQKGTFRDNKVKIGSREKQENYTEKPAGSIIKFINTKSLHFKLQHKKFVQNKQIYKKNYDNWLIPRRTNVS